MKSKFEAWFEQQYFHNQLKYIHGDRLFDFDEGIGYRNLTVQVAYVAFFGRDAECVLGGDQIAQKDAEMLAATGVRGGDQNTVNTTETHHAGQRVKVDFISESSTEFSGQHFCGEGVIDRLEDGDIVANLEKPMDIPRNSNGEQRWIDIRLNELPKKPVVMQVPRTEKQPKMVKRIKYAPQLTYITKMEDLIDDSGNVVKFKGRNFQNPVTHIHTDANGTPILTDQPVVSESGETVFEFVQAVDGEGNLVFEDAPVLDEDGNQIFDEVIHEP